MYNMTNVFVCDESTLNENCSDSETFPRAILTCKGKASFRDRNLNLCQPVKIGRAVGKCRPTAENGVFDCKVLSRNHALLFYEKNKFFLQDTGSSNGTFVNDVRLSTSNENSLPKQVFSGDHVQFGVDVTESTKYLTIPCIAASLKLYHPDGSEAKAIEFGLNSNVKHFNAFELTGWLQEARQREEALRNKLVTLSAVIHKAVSASQNSWKSMIEEDVFLSRIESLQTRIKSLLESPDHNKPDEVIVHLWKEVMNLQEERERYETKAKEAIQNVLQEKLLVISKNYELQVALNSAEEQRDHYKNACDSLLEEMKKLAEEHDKQFKELQEMQENYKVLAAAFESISKESKSLGNKSQQLTEEETSEKGKPKENGIDENHRRENSFDKNCDQLDDSMVEDKYSTIIKEKKVGQLNSSSDDELIRPQTLPSADRITRRTSYSTAKLFMENDDEDTIQDLISSLGYKTRASNISDSRISDSRDKLSEFRQAIQKHIESQSALSLMSSELNPEEMVVGNNQTPDESITTQSNVLTNEKKSLDLDNSTGQLNDGQQSDDYDEEESDCNTDDETNTTIGNGDSIVNSSQENIADYSPKDNQSFGDDSLIVDETLISNETILEAPIKMMNTTTPTTVMMMSIPVINELKVGTIDETDAVNFKPYKYDDNEKQVASVTDKQNEMTNYEIKKDYKPLSSSANTNIVPKENMEMPPISPTIIGNNYNSVQTEAQSMSDDNITSKINESSLLIDKDYPANKWETNMGFNISLFFFSLSFFLSFFIPFSLFFFFSSFFFFSLILSRFIHSLVFCLYQLILFTLLFFLTFFSSLSSFFFPLFSLLFIIIYLFLFFFFFLSIYF